MQAQYFSCSRIGNIQPWLQANDRERVQDMICKHLGIVNVCGVESRQVRRLRFLEQRAAVDPRSLGVDRRVAFAFDFSYHGTRDLERLTARPGKLGHVEQRRANCGLEVLVII
jgi:hypothetical protein